MTHQPTHTHRESGGKFTEIERIHGGGASEGWVQVIYHDIDRDVRSYTNPEDWKQNWREIAPDDCTVCMGTGHDHIKGNKDRPCGHCYGLGGVRSDGEAATDLWELATVATGIIERQKKELGRLRQIENHPDVQALIDQQRQQAMSDSVAHQERQWRDGKGHGPGGQRYTGD